MNQRRLRAEILDHVPDHWAHPNLADLVRINRYFGGHSIALKLLRSLNPDPDFSMLDIGAASGDHARAISRAYPRAGVVCSDLHHRNLTAAPEPRLVADAFRLPFAPKSFDYVFSSLFLHHFEEDEIVDLLQSFHQIARRAVIIIDLHRHPLPRRFLPATKWLFGWNAITIHDGVISIDAGFTVAELAALARRANLPQPAIRKHVPWFRLSMVSVVSAAVGNPATTPQVFALSKEP